MKNLYCENNLRKELQLLTVFATHSIVDVWQSSEYASASDLEYTRVLNMSEYTWKCRNMCECAYISLNGFCVTSP